jgi:CheY-like chemotaxis protein
VKFTDVGEVHLQVSLVRSEGSDLELDFVVKDTGTGISPDRLESIFLPFTQEHDGISRQRGGTGLGLTICRRLVGLMAGGELQVESELGKGSQFFFRLPFRRASLAESRSQHLLKGRRARVLTTGSWCERSLIWSLQRWGIQVVDERDTSEIDFVCFVCPGEQERISPSFLLNRPSGSTRPLVAIDYLGRKNRAEICADLGLAGLAAGPVLCQDFYSLLCQLLCGESGHERSSRDFRIESSKRGSLNILVAEDNRINQKVICSFLKRLGHRFVVAEDGLKAVECAQSQMFDIVLMDVSMPHCDGFEATRRLRQLGHRLPIYALTAHSLDQERSACFNAGMDGFLSKPLQLEKLSELLERVLATREVRELKQVSV